MDCPKYTWRARLVCALLAAATFAAFGPVLHYAFIHTNEDSEGHLWFRVT